MGLDGADEVSEVAPCIFDFSFLGRSHPVFDLGEGLLDGVEVWRVWRQEQETGANGSDGLAYGLGFVAAQIVHNHDIAGFEGGDELLIHIGAEALAIDRTIEDAWRGQPFAPQGGQEGHGAPVPVWCKTAQSLSFGPPTANRRHVGFDPGLVNEHKMARIEAVLP